MINTLKKIIDQTKSISTTDIMVFVNGDVFNFGDDEQYIKAIVNIEENKNVKKLGLDKMSFTINFPEFLEFEKNYKKEYTECEETTDSYILKTKIPSVKLVLPKLKANDIPDQLFDLDELEYYGTFEFTEENKQQWLDKTVQRLFLNFDDGTIEFGSTSAESYLFVSVLSSKFGKINKSDTKSIEIDVYDHGENEFLLHWKIMNKDIQTNIFFVSIDSPPIEEE